MTVVNVFPLFLNIHSESKYWLCFTVYKKLKTCESNDTSKTAPTGGKDWKLRIFSHGVKRAEYVFICYPLASHDTFKDCVI